MAGARLGPALRHIQQLFHEGSATGLSDTHLLRLFAARRDERAFASLLLRHGPMVLGVCRGILRNPADAEDAFQATFLVLARKAGSAWGEGQLGGWLHKVAYRIAIRASIDAATRRRHERRAAEQASVAYTHVELDEDLRPALHEEIARLPARFGLPVVLCYLEGLTHAQAAIELACGEATVRRRLAGARGRLRARLARRGFMPAAAILSATLVNETIAGVPTGYARATVAAAIRVAAGEAIGAAAGTRVATLARGGLSMIGTGWKTAALAALGLTTLAGLVGGVAVSDDKQHVPMAVVDNLAADPPTRRPSLADVIACAQTGASLPAKFEAQETWPLTLAQALQIALDNGDGARVLSFGAPDFPPGGSDRTPLKALGPDRQRQPAATVIMQLNPKESLWEFKSRVMAKLREVEQQYWNLAQAHVHLWSSDQAVRMAREIQTREQAELAAGRRTAADVAEANQRFEQFNLDLVTRTSDVITTERQLRNILGLPSSDDRRIIPCTPPLEAEFVPDWDICLGEMIGQQPDVALKKLAVANRSLRVKPGTADDQHEALRRALQQTIHEKTHWLARCFLGIDANYKQFKTASRLRAAAAQRLDAQRPFYEEGRITIDRFLDTVSLYATSVATEAQYKMTFNVSICALEEAKGTLLAHDNIAVAEGPGGGVAFDPSNPQAAPTALATHPVGHSPATSTTKPQPALAPTAADNSAPIPVVPATPILPPGLQPGDGSTTAKPTAAGHNKADASGEPAPRTWSFSFSIGRDRPFVIKGTIIEGVDRQPGAPDH